MSLLGLINESFPANREPGREIYVWTRGGAILAGNVRQCDNRGIVLDTPRGTVLVFPRSVVAISDRRDALGPAIPTGDDP